MQHKQKHINQIITAISRVFTLTLLLSIFWFSYFWEKEKYSSYKPTVMIEGYSVLDNDYYLKYLESSISNEIFKLNSKDIIDKLYQHPYISAARVSYRYPDKLIIEIRERTPFARLNNNLDGTILLDENCFVLPIIEGLDNYSLPILSRFNSDPTLYPIGEKSLSFKIRDTINWLKKLNQKYPDLYQSISEIFLANNDEINLVLTENPTRIMLGNENTHYKIDLIKHFQKTLNNKKEITDFAYLDMRYNNQVIVKE